VVGLDTPGSDQGVFPLFQGMSDQEFQFPGFISPHAQAGEVIPFHMDGRPIDRLCQGFQIVNGGWKFSQPEPGQCV
jgi:hypothetical protein